MAMSILNNRYQLETEVGRGGMAIVYQGRDLMLERPVAIKVLREKFSRDPGFRERFRQEAKAAANLSHPNIVTVHDFGYDEERLFIVMEYLPGTDLKTMLNQRGRFSIDETLPLLIQACAGIGYAHRAGLVHCDVKPHNMLITPDKRLKVGDFGIARALASINPDEQSNMVWGSPHYFSPEQAKGNAPSPASDVYSLGIILYEMLTGKLPFDGNSSNELIYAHLNQQLIPPGMINPHIPESLEKIILKVLSKEPSARYRTADQLGRVLLTFSQQKEPPVEVVRDDSGDQNWTNNTPPSFMLEDKDSHPIQGNYQGISLGIDWITIGLMMLALISVGGLIPFWLWIYFLFNPPLQ